MHRDRRILKGIAAGGAISCLLLATCEPFTAPQSGGGGASNVTIAFGATSFAVVGETLYVPVGLKLLLPVTATAASVPVQNPIYTLSSQDNSVAKPTTSLNLHTVATITHSANRACSSPSAHRLPRSRTPRFVSCVPMAPPTSNLRKAPSWPENGPISIH